MSDDDIKDTGDELVMTRRGLARAEKNRVLEEHVAAARSHLREAENELSGTEAPTYVEGLIHCALYAVEHAGNVLELDD